MSHQVTISPNMICKKIFLGWVTLTCLLWTSIAFSKSGQKNSLNDVVQRIQRWNDSLKNIAVFIESQHLNRSKNQIVSSIYAAKGEMRFSSIWHGPKSARDLDPFSTTQFYNGDVFDLFFHFSRRYETTKKHANQEFLWKVQKTMYFESLGWWPNTDASKPPTTRGQPCFLPDILKDHRLQLIGSDIVRGRACDILEIPNVVRLYIGKKNGIPYRRDLLHNVNNRVHPWATFHFKDYRKENGILIPHTVERIFPELHIHTVAKVKFCEVNSVPDDFFSIPLQPGSMIINRDTGETTLIPGGLDCMTRMLNYASAKISKKNKKTTQSKYTSSMIFILFILGWMLNLFVPGSKPKNRFQDQPNVE
ncbi:hypothetical protein [Gimesia sp.]|uniref:hypothetical protein n=1 Tax=Gimesia sp. TaxID=2024833 RepID=UPI0032EBA134